MPPATASASVSVNNWRIKLLRAQRRARSAWRTRRAVAALRGEQEIDHIDAGDEQQQCYRGKHREHRRSGLPCL